MAELMAEDADVCHLRPALVDDQIIPPPAIVQHPALVRPEKAAAGDGDALAGIDECDPIKPIECALAFAGKQFVQHFRQQLGVVAGAEPVLGPLLSLLDPIEHRAFEPKLAAESSW